MRRHSLDSQRTGPLDGGPHIWSFSKISAGFLHQTANKEKHVDSLVKLNSCRRKTFVITMKNIPERI